MIKKNTPGILKKGLLCLALITSFKGVFAEDTPTRTYAWGTVAPTIYFNSGIISPGTNYNLLDLVSGASVYSATSGYVESTANRLFALFRVLWLLQHRTESQPSQYWVYTIRPSVTFYNVANSLRSSAQAVQDTNPVLYNRLMTAEELMRTSRSNIWVTRGMIVPTQIESATLYQLVNNNLVEMTTMRNPNYIPTAPIVSPNNIVVTGSEDQNIFYGNMGPFNALPGPFCTSFSSSSGTKLTKISTESDTCIQHTYGNLKFKLRYNLVLLAD